jgi:hypothetical protein
MSEVWEHSKSQATQLLLLLAIADYADDDGVAYPTIFQLSQKCRQSPRATSYQLASLQELGELVIVAKKGRGNRNQYRVITRNDKNMQKLHVLGDTENMQSSAENMQHVACVSIHPSCNNRHEENKQRARAHEGVSKKTSPFILPNLAQFTADYFDLNLEKFLEENCPAVAPQKTTALFLEFHQAENTQFKNGAAMIRAWKGWMRNAQSKAEERSAQRTARKENGNGTNRPNHQAKESRNMRNLRAIVEELGPLPERNTLRGNDLVQDAARKIAAAKRAANERAIRESIDRSRLGRGNQGHTGGTSG